MQKKCLKMENIFPDSWFEFYCRIYSFNIPYEYGNYDDLEIEANQMLKKATEIDIKT
jgi:hypothetical protein